MSETRVFIEVLCEDDHGISPADWELPDDINAQGVIDLLKKDSKGNIDRAIREFSLLQWPQIKVRVWGPNGDTEAYWGPVDV